MSDYKMRRSLVLGVLVMGAASMTTASATGLFGPSKFRIEQSDDRFSGDGLTTVTGRNNRLSSRSVSGGLYIDGEGVYLDPMATKNRADGKVQRVGFIIHNETNVDGRIGSPNAFGALQKISFLIDGGRLINAEIIDSAQHGTGASSYNPYLRSSSTNISETGVINISTDDMAALAATHSLAVQIQGSERGWTCEANQVSKQFLPNLASFYQQVVVAAH